MSLEIGKTYEVVLTWRVTVRHPSQKKKRYLTAPGGTRGTVHVDKALTFRTRKGWYGVVTMLDFRLLTPLELLAEAAE